MCSERAMYFVMPPIGQLLVKRIVVYCSNLAMVAKTHKYLVVYSPVSAKLQGREYSNVLAHARNTFSQRLLELFNW